MKLFATILLLCSLPLQAANLLYNSGFELGQIGHATAKGKLGYDSFAGDVGLLTTNSYAGRWALVMPPESQNEYSPRLIRLQNNISNLYTLSFYAKVIENVGQQNYFMLAVWPLNQGQPSATNTLLLPTGDWARYSVSFALDPTADVEWIIQMDHRSAATVAIDNIQLEEGSSATAYTPASPVEITLLGDRRGNVLFPGDDKRAGVVGIASAASTNLVRFEVYDFLNRLLTVSSNTIEFPEGISTNWFALPDTNGPLRVVARCAGSGTIAESLFSVLPTISGTNATLASHISPNAGQINWWKTNTGIAWTRSLSPGGFFRWSVIEPTEGNFTWTAADLLVDSSTNMQILASLTDANLMPSWALTNGVPQLDKWSNYVWQVVNRYKDRITYWEDINEPSEVFNATNYAGMLAQTVGAVKTADATATFIAFGGLRYTEWPDAVWANLAAGAKTQIDAVSCHLYPPSGSDWQDPQPDAGYVNFTSWAAGIGKPVWHTETGGYTFGSIRSTASITRWSADVWRTVHWDTLWRSLVPYWRSMGYGMIWHFYYESRFGAYPERDQITHPTLWNDDESLTGAGAALIWAGSLLPSPVGGQLLNHSGCGTMVEAYLFESGANAALVVWSEQKTNRTFTVTNASFAVYDPYGNLLQTNVSSVPIGIIPRYLISSVLNTNQLATTYLNSTVVTNADTTAPYLSIDEAPFVYTNNYMRLRWTAWDDTAIPAISQQSAIESRYNVGAGWSAWGITWAVDVNSVPTAFSVEARDWSGNTNSATWVAPGTGYNITIGNLTVLGNFTTQ